MALFKSNPKTNLGIDIGASAVKVVELEKINDRYNLKNYAILPIHEYLKKEDPQANFANPNILDDQLIEMIRATLTTAAITNKKVRVSVPVYSSFSTLIELPLMPQSEIAAAVPFEAKKYIPVPITDVILDWSVLEKSKDKMQLLLVAVLKEIVEKYSIIFQKIGLKLEFVESETFSLARVLVGNDKSGIVLVDVGSRASNISIIDKGFIRVIQNLELGGNELTKIIATNMKLSLDQAESLKKSQERWPELVRLIHDSADKIILEIQKLIQDYTQKYKSPIEKCILVGAAAKTYDFKEYFSKKMQMEVTVGNPFARIVYPQTLTNPLKDIGLSLAVAVGLAMRE